MFKTLKLTQPRGLTLPGKSVGALARELSDHYPSSRRRLAELPLTTSALKHVDGRARATLAWSREASCSESAVGAAFLLILCPFPCEFYVRSVQMRSAQDCLCVTCRSLIRYQHPEPLPCSKTWHCKPSRLTSSARPLRCDYKHL